MKIRSVGQLIERLRCDWRLIISSSSQREVLELCAPEDVREGGFANLFHSREHIEKGWRRFVSAIILGLGIGVAILICLWLNSPMWFLWFAAFWLAVNVVVCLYHIYWVRRLPIDQFQVDRMRNISVQLGVMTGIVGLKFTKRHADSPEYFLTDLCRKAREVATHNRVFDYTYHRELKRASAEALQTLACMVLLCECEAFLCFNGYRSRQWKEILVTLNRILFEAGARPNNGLDDLFAGAKNRLGLK